MRKVYSERLQFLLSEWRQRLRGLLEISEIEAGLQTVGWLSEGISGVAAAKTASSRDIEVVPLSKYSCAPYYCVWPAAKTRWREGLQRGFAAISQAEIRRGVQDLAIALEHLIREKKVRRASSH